LQYTRGKRGLFGLILFAVILLTVIGLGWKTFSSGVITGLEKALDIGTPVIKDLTQEAREYVKGVEQQGEHLGHLPLFVTG
jgi:uncharacterized membrane protein